MPKTKFILSILSLPLTFTLLTSSFAFTISANNEARYARRGLGDPQTGDNWGWFENQLDIDANEKNLHLNMRIRYLRPSEFELRQTDESAIDKGFAEYSLKHLTLRGGDYYRSWGRGLLLGMVEVKELNFDNGLNGVLAEGGYKGLEGSFFWGEEKDAADTPHEAAAGFRLGYRLPWDINLGLAAIHFRDGERHAAFERRGFEFDIPFSIGSLYSAYVYDSYDPVSQRYSHGFYSAAEFYGAGWGLLIDYKNYRLPQLDQLALQHPPSVRPEVTWSLFDRYPHTSLYDSEVGCQVDLTASVENWNFKWNVNQVSRQDGVQGLPSRRDRLMPYWATTFLVGNHLTDRDRWELFGGYAEQTSLAERHGGGCLYEHFFDDQWSLTTELQLLWNKKIPWTPQYRDALLSLTGSKAGLASLTALIERSGNIWDLSGAEIKKESLRKILSRDRYWPSIELAVNYFARHQLRLFYGYERGGMRCSGGLCRQVNPFKGVKITLNSQF